MWNRLTGVAKIAGILAIGGMLALGGKYGWEKYQATELRDRLIQQLVLIANHNIKVGKLDLPPEMKPQVQAAPAPPQESK